MRCPYCPATLTAREYLWTHTHVSKYSRPLGFGMMVAGAFSIAVAVVEFYRG